MWCAKCRADVAAEVSSDNTRIRCASCACEIAPTQSLRSTVKTREARELLERWSSGSVLDPYSPTLGSRPSAPPRSEPAPAPPAPHFERQLQRAAQQEHFEPAVRFEAPSMAAARPSFPAAPVHVEPSAPAQNIEFAPAHFAPAPRIDAAHAAPVRRPHLDIQASTIEAEAERTDWLSIAGHLLAYGGVTLLTFGSVLVIWSQFGGPANYAPSGWLVTIFGQMLTFLGGVTLVTRNMEQTASAVDRRVSAIADRLDRIELATRAQAGDRATIPVGDFNRAQAAPQQVRRAA